MVNLPGILDTVIALVAIYLAVAVLCSHINEQIAAITQSRGKVLYAGILNLLLGISSVVTGIYEHPLVTSSSNDPNGKTRKRMYRPSFIDARNFTLAFWDTVQRTQKQQASDGTPTIVVSTAQSLVDTPPQLFAALKQKVVDFPDGDLQRHMAALINQAQEDYNKLLTVTDDWFNRQMNLVSGWYKRRTQCILFCISLIVVLGLGLDSIRIASRLYADPATRDVLTQHIIALTPKNENADVLAKVINGSLSSLPVETYLVGPMGIWDATYWKSLTSHENVRTDALHVLGLLITAAAGALGGPLWFDLLNTLINVRLSGPKPADQTKDS